MTNLPLRRIAVAVSLLALATSARADTEPKISELGNNTYSVTVSATNKFTRNTARLKAEASEAASAFCAKQGRQMKLLSVDEKKSFYGIGDMASATLTFKALELTDPELAKAAPALAAGTPSVAPETAPLTNEALYADLLRLDDLRKKGILTDEEFAAEKKKVLDRSK